MIVKHPTGVVLRRRRVYRLNLICPCVMISKHRPPTSDRGKVSDRYRRWGQLKFNGDGITLRKRTWISVSPLILCCSSVLVMRGTMKRPGGSWSPEPQESPGGRAGCGQKLVRSAPPRTCCLWYRWTAPTRRATPACSSPRPAVMKTWFVFCYERGPRWTATTTTAGPRWCRLLGGAELKAMCQHPPTKPHSKN